ncbi:hypothetical protein QN404_13100, partial [Pseudomonas sp. RTS1]
DVYKRQLPQFEMRLNVGAGLARDDGLTHTHTFTFVHNSSFLHPSMSFFNRSRVAVPAIISYHFRK